MGPLIHSTLVLYTQAEQHNVQNFNMKFSQGLRFPIPSEF